MAEMPITKAIELLQAILLTGEYEGDPDDSDAITLGIEALTCILEFKKELFPLNNPPSLKRNRKEESRKE